MAAYINFIAGNLENRQYNYFEGRNKLHRRKPMRGHQLYLTDFASIEIANETSVKRLGGTLGGALVGGFLLGGVGALVGGLSQGADKEMTVIVTLRDGKKSLAKVNNAMFEAIQSHLFKLEENPDYAPFPVPDEKKDKKKMALWKKIVLAIFILIILAGIFAEDKKDKQKDTTSTSSQTNQKK